MIFAWVWFHNAANGSGAEPFRTGLSQTSLELQEGSKGTLGLGQMHQGTPATAHWFLGG